MFQVSGNVLESVTRSKVTFVRPLNGLVKGDASTVD